VTNAKVWAIMDVARSFFARTKGIKTHERSSCGRKANDSAWRDGDDDDDDDDDDDGVAEARYRRVL
jgi:hypothetical protein